MSKRAGTTDYAVICVATGEVLEGGRAMRNRDARMLALWETTSRMDAVEREFDRRYAAGEPNYGYETTEELDAALAAMTFVPTPAFLVPV